jgi:colanic acid/amylovoran biosynthesis glycosyltransferase
MLTVVQWVRQWLPQTETWLYNQVRFLPPAIESHIVCETTENLNQFALPHIHALDQAGRWRQFWDKRLHKLRVRRHYGFLVQQARRLHARLLHSHFGNAGWANLRAAAQARLKHVVTFYGYDVSQLPRLDPRWHQRYRQLFAGADRVLCEGSHMAGCVEALGCPAGKLRVHHLGVSTNEIAFQPRQWNGVEPLRVLIAASFREKKGIPFALEALGRFQAQVPIEITLIGDASRQASSQAEKRKILATIEACQLQARVRLLGYQPYAVFFEEAYRHHLFLSPSVSASDGDTEGGAPLGLIEMAATGMPVLSSTHCDIPSVIRHETTGYLARERDVEGLVAGLKWWTAEPARWRTILEAGRRHIDRDYDAQKQGERLAQIYEEVSQGCPQPLNLAS